jgi:hypothetical protein
MCPLARKYAAKVLPTNPAMVTVLGANPRRLRKLATGSNTPLKWTRNQSLKLVGFFFCMACSDKISPGKNIVFVRGYAIAMGWNCQAGYGN